MWTCRDNKGLRRMRKDLVVPKSREYFDNLYECRDFFICFMEEINFVSVSPVLYNLVFEDKAQMLRVLISKSTTSSAGGEVYVTIYRSQDSEIISTVHLKGGMLKVFDGLLIEIRRSYDLLYTEKNRSYE